MNWVGDFLVRAVLALGFAGLSAISAHLHSEAIKSGSAAGRFVSVKRESDPRGFELAVKLQRFMSLFFLILAGLTAALPIS